MALALFDLDNTLIAGDSDYLWGKFLSDIGAVDADNHERENQRFYQEYRDGRLDIHEFLRFSLLPLSQHTPQQLAQWREQFMVEYIDPVILQMGINLIQHHKERGHIPLIVTATNAFVTAPIAARLGVSVLLATEPEFLQGHYTGRVAGTPCFQQGKVVRVEAWIEEHGESWQGSYFYSDSHNDLPLLERVTYPVAVDPDPALRQQAQTRGWPIISLRTADCG